MKLLSEYESARILSCHLSLFDQRYPRVVSDSKETQLVRFEQEVALGYLLSYFTSVLGKE